MRLRTIREERGLTQKEVADLLHIRQNTYSQYESSQRSIPIPCLILLADFYGTSVDYILSRTNVDTPYPRD